MEEDLYAQLWQHDLQIKQAKEERDIALKNKMKQDTLQVLEWQKTQNQSKNVIEKELTEAEKEMLKTHWQVEN